MITDVLLAFAAAVLVGLVPVNWFVAWRFLSEARKPPSSPTLWLAAVRSTLIAIAESIGGLLGLGFLQLAVTGEFPLARPWPQILIAVAFLIVGAANVYALWVLRRFVREQRQLHIHQRDTEQPRWHRRHDDLPPEAP